MFDIGTLDQLADITMGQSPKGTSVSNLGEVPLLNGPTEFGINHPTPVQFTNDPKRFAKKGDILFCVRGSTTGRMNWSDRDYAIGRGLASIRAKNQYSRYFIRGSIELFLKELLQSATGSTFPNINKDQLHKMTCYLPDEGNLKKIDEVLRNISQKIELNKKTNETLEEIAKTLFKSWFIDFDPVKAKAEGRPTRLSKEIRDLFPDSFEDSELGKIPKGWKAGSLNDIIVRSKDKIKDTKSKVLAAVSSGELVLSEEYFSKQVFSKDISKYIKVEQYDFAYNPSRINIGSIGMNEYDFIGAVSPVYVVFKPFTHWHLFISQFIRLKSTNSKINQLSSGSVRQSLSFDDFASIPITIPTDVANMKFNEIYESLRRKITQNQEECEILTSLRDTLLPKLISGELKISDAENLIEEAGI